MENTVNIVGDDKEGLVGDGIEKNNISLSSDEEHLKSENDFLSENGGNSNKANLGSYSPLMENFSSGFLRSQSMQSIASLTVEVMNNRSRSYADLHCMGDGAVDFLIEHHGSDSEGKILSGHRSGSSGKETPEYRLGLYGGGSPEHRPGLYGRSSPEHGSGLYGIVSPEHRSSLYGKHYPEPGSCDILSPAHGSDSDGRIYPEPAIDEYITETSQTYNVDKTEELNREIIEEEDDNIKRIKNWINQIDINSDMIVEELGGSSESESGTGPIPDKMSSI
jgi:hypothetical protein